MIKDELKKAISIATGRAEGDINIEKPKNNQADYASSVFGIAKEEGKNANDVGKVLTNKLSNEKLSGIERIEASGGYVNFFLTPAYLQEELLRISRQENYGTNETLKGKKVMVEYTDPNPFKLFHIGHLMSNTIGESIARLYGASGATVSRVTWQGDVGMHIAMAVWAIKTNQVGKNPTNEVLLAEKMNYLGQAYAAGAAAFNNKDSEARKEIEEINKEIYKKDNPEINQIYNLGREWSLKYFEEVYSRLGSKFDEYFFESELASVGLDIVKNNPNVFQESEGAIIFKGEDYGLHTRVFINSKGLPVYEAKELGLNKVKFDTYHPDLSVIVTGNEINEYFKVLLKVMELIMPEVAQKTRHIGHGMMRLPTGKMSSRTGDVVTADSLIDQTKDVLKEKESGELDDSTREVVAIGALKYTILKQSPGKDIVFDFDKSLAVKGDSGPYLQYTYARLRAILAKAGESSIYELAVSKLIEESELALMKHFLEFPDVVRESAEMIAPQRVALYIFELANLANNFYEKVRVLDDEDAGRKAARLILVRTAADILSRGAGILGIKTPERI